MRKVFSSQAQVDAWLEEVGFTLEDGKAYWTADETRESYLSITQNQNATYHASNGTDYIISQYANAAYCIVEYFELINGGIAMRFSFTNDATAVIGVPLQLAIVAKEDGSGFVYFFVSSRLKYDDLSGAIKEPSQWSTLNLGDTNSIAMVTKAYDNVANFIDAHARVVLAAQNVSAAMLFTFTCGDKKYLSGMFTTNATQKCGQLCFEIE